MTDERKIKTQEVGRRVKSIRKAKKLSQAKLAELIHCSQNNIAMIEAGKRGLTTENINLIADKCDILPDYLLLRSDYMTEEEKVVTELGTEYYINVEREQILKIFSEKAGYHLLDGGLLAMGDIFADSKPICFFVDSEGVKTPFTWDDVCELTDDLEEYATMRIKRTIALKRRLQENG